MKPRIALKAALFSAATAVQPEVRRIAFCGSERVFALQYLEPRRLGSLPIPGIKTATLLTRALRFPPAHRGRRALASGCRR